MDDPPPRLDDRPEKAAENPDRDVPLTESERTPRESLADLIPGPPEDQTDR